MKVKQSSTRDGSIEPIEEGPIRVNQMVVTSVTNDL